MLTAAADIGFEPAAAVMIEPAYAFHEGALLDVPMLLIRGECDEDVGPEADRDLLITALDPQHAASVVDLLFRPRAIGCSTRV